MPITNDDDEDSSVDSEASESSEISENEFRKRSNEDNREFVVRIYGRTKTCKYNSFYNWLYSLFLC